MSLPPRTTLHSDSEQYYLSVTWSRGRSRNLTYLPQLWLQAKVSALCGSRSGSGSITLHERGRRRVHGFGRGQRHGHEHEPGYGHGYGHGHGH